MIKQQTPGDNFQSDLIVPQHWLLILRQKKLLWFTAGYNQVSVLVPLLVALPNYFNKVFELGGLIQSLAAFDRIQLKLDKIGAELETWNKQTQKKSDEDIKKWQSQHQGLQENLDKLKSASQQAGKNVETSVKDLETKVDALWTKITEKHQK